MTNNIIDHNLQKNSSDYGISLTTYNFANYFEIIPLKDGPIFNFHKGFIVKNIDYMPISYYDSYQITEGDQWPLISYKFYGSVELWWVICKFNQIDDPLFLPNIGTYIKIPKKDIVLQLIEQLRKS